MKNILLVFVMVVVFSVDCKAQDTIPKFQLAYNGFVGVDENSVKHYLVLDVPSKSKKELYSSCLVSLSKMYTYPNKVLSTVENESIVINGFIQSLKDKNDLYNYQLYYNINIQFKEGKLKIEPVISKLFELPTFSEKKNRIYIVNTNSSKKGEIHCIWMLSKKTNEYFLFKKELKNIIDNWMNAYVSRLHREIKVVDNW